MGYKLFLDDERPVPSPDWVLARSVAEAIEIIESHGLPYAISFDHDMGIASLPLGKPVGRFIRSISGWFRPGVVLNPTGIALAEYIRQNFRSQDLRPHVFGYAIHSANREGSDAIRDIMLYATGREPLATGPWWLERNYERLFIMAHINAAAPISKANPHDIGYDFGDPTAFEKPGKDKLP